ILAIQERSPMPTRRRRSFTPRFKAQIALEVLAGLISLRFLLGALAFQLLDGLARRQVLAGQAEVVLRVAVGPEDRIAAEAARGAPRRATGARRAAGSGGWCAGPRGRAAGPAGAAPACHHGAHLFELLVLVVVQQRLDLAVDFHLERRHGRFLAGR